MPAAEAVRGVARVMSLLAVNSALGSLLTGPDIGQRLRSAAPAPAVVAAVSPVSRTAAGGRHLCHRAANVALAAIEDHACRSAGSSRSSARTAPASPGWQNFSGRHELSGCQGQRLGIARAAHRCGQVLIVDEPTAALDARAEPEVFEKIRALAGNGQTVALITHRLASVRHADLVHVLEHGRLMESGTPEELLARGGVYTELYALQAEQFTAEVPAPKPA
ncbi:hypothetical protein M878_34330 [Streptomyces roseochromogenus subsp. oscitans DS 12.976]|uniref:ABC transporter domain-containing protein n=1 Tax=Streptomyces roseochromogenus subsp. oscitans DS 12.976 TaxID=1352936 RepID=V6JSN4_STRRC|nr:hypothetical protein M878_34330 [Streptomyces roseochromogenus subsp. oscitans DS 12.976]